MPPLRGHGGFQDCAGRAAQIAKLQGFALRHPAVLKEPTPSWNQTLQRRSALKVQRGSVSFEILHAGIAHEGDNGRLRSQLFS